MLAGMTTAAALLTDIRTRSGMSQRALAAAAGVTPSTIARIEAGRSDATLGMLERLAAAAGRRLEYATPAAGPTIASLASKTTNGEPAWIHARGLADWIHEHPSYAGASIADAPAPTGSAAVDSLMAAIAETIADDYGIPAPGWCAAIPAVDEPWEHPGTPAMRQRSRSAAPPRFAARNIWLARNATWREW